MRSRTHEASFTRSWRADAFRKQAFAKNTRQERSRMPLSHHFVVHDCVTVQVDASATTASTRQLLGPFATLSSAAPDVLIFGSVDAARSLAAAPTSTRFGQGLEYSDDWIYSPKHRLILIRNNGTWIIGSDRDMEAFVLPIVDLVMSERGLATVHAAAVSIRERGVLLAGWGGVGKTSSLVSILGESESKFLADDLTFVSVLGQLGAFQKSMYVYPYHRDLYPHLFEENRKPLVPSRLSTPMAAVRQVVRPAVERFPSVEAAARRWTPEHMKVDPRSAFPSAEFAEHAELSTILYLERSNDPEVRVLGRSDDWARSRLSETLYAELPQRARDFLTIAAGAGLISLAEWFRQREEVLSGGLAGANCLNVLIPKAVSANEVGIIVRDILRGEISDASIE